MTFWFIGVLLSLLGVSSKEFFWGLLTETNINYLEKDFCFLTFWFLALQGGDSWILSLFWPYWFNFGLGWVQKVFGGLSIQISSGKELLWLGLLVGLSVHRWRKSKILKLTTLCIIKFRLENINCLTQWVSLKRFPELKPNSFGALFKPI